MKKKKTLKLVDKALYAAIDELGVPHTETPAPVANAYDILQKARAYVQKELNK